MSTLSQEGRGGIALKRLERAPFFTPKTLAAYLAVSERTVRQMVASGRIPSYRVEGARRISAEDVDAYLERNRDGRR